ncbi:MAG: hypothetical protein WC538_20210 [Thermoanaerobaculia bacterium]|jgi:hypothetical protein
MGKGAYNDIAILDAGQLHFARLAAGSPRPRLAMLGAWRLNEGTFGKATLTPSLDDAKSLVDAIGKMKFEAGRVDRVTLLLPDCWFRINIVEVGNLPRNHADADEVVNWTLKRTTPFNPAELRTVWLALPTRTVNGTRVLVISALEKSLAAIEAAFRGAGVAVGAIESSGLNVWNAIVSAEAPADGRLLVYLRDEDFTTAMFRGSEPLFIRSRSVVGERTIEQELRLSASHLQKTLESTPVRRCYVAGDGQVTSSVLDAIRSEFGGEVEVLTSSRFADTAGIATAGHIDAGIIACRGALTA